MKTTATQFAGFSFLFLLVLTSSLHGQDSDRSIHSGDLATRSYDKEKLGLKRQFHSQDHLIVTNDGTIWMQSSNLTTILSESTTDDSVVAKQVPWRHVEHFEEDGVIPSNLKSLSKDLYSVSASLGGFSECGDSKIIAPLFISGLRNNQHIPLYNLVTMSKDGMINFIELSNPAKIYARFEPYSRNHNDVAWSIQNQTLYFLLRDLRADAERGGAGVMLCAASLKDNSLIPVSIDGGTDISNSGSPEYLISDDACIHIDETGKRIMIGPFDYGTYDPKNFVSDYPGDSYRYVFYDIPSGRHHYLRLNGDITDLFNPGQSGWVGQRYCSINPDQRVTWWDDPSQKNSEARVDASEIHGDALMLFQAEENKLGVISEDGSKYFVTVCSFNSDGLVKDVERRIDFKPDFVESHMAFEVRWDRLTRINLTKLLE